MPEPDPILKSFGDNLRAARLERGLTQEALAELAGLHWTYIGQVERGLRNITLKNIVSLCRALSVNVSALVDTISG